MWALLIGYKTFGLVAVSIIAQVVGSVKPEYASTCNTVSTYALMGTPVTIRMAIGSLGKK